MKFKLKKIRLLNKKEPYQWLHYIRIYTILDFTSWYSVLKHFKLQQVNIISFFLFFVQSDPDVFHLPWLPQI